MTPIPFLASCRCIWPSEVILRTTTSKRTPKALADFLGIAKDSLEEANRHTETWKERADRSQLETGRFGEADSDKSDSGIRTQGFISDVPYISKQECCILIELGTFEVRIASGLARTID
ncbi:hypothetical protein S40285_09982 [Stachybotrys chlorohalonatus IBT 40285]|uniref:Uncharacterized protein n=1 Tax=Stachybotrys chlorohalonatus (strain IBT 40285) TaxID=1283841 RepID=A0A084QPR9_STAC4|nr:hypothetical protein S40285_09982 [Stachybotrys chlorohalonata IBT 40285]